MIRPVTFDDAEQLAALYNYYILHSVVTFEVEPIDAQQMQQRIEQTPVKLPWLVIENDGIIVGYAKLSRWRIRAAYDRSVETSIYIKNGENGKGYGEQLYVELLKQTKALGYHAIIAGMSMPNAASEHIHQKLGFEKVAHFKQTGFKFDRWIDTAYWQLMR